MLDFATCRALAEAYREIREHESQPGDWYYLRSHDDYDGEPRAIASGNEPAAYDDWIPRLDQLLEIAEKYLPEWKLYRMVPSDGRATHAFGEAFGGGTRDSEELDPEAAVAAWLLARAKGAKETQGDRWPELPGSFNRPAPMGDWTWEPVRSGWHWRNTNHGVMPVFVHTLNGGFGVWLSDGMERIEDLPLTLWLFICESPPEPPLGVRPPTSPPDKD